MLKAMEETRFVHILHQNVDLEAKHDKIDIFEGGPILSAATQTIRTIKQSVLVQVDVTSETLSEESEFLLGNERLDYRACMGKLKLINKNEAVIHEENGVVVPPESADLLSQAIIELLRNPEKSRIMGMSNRKLIEAKFTLSHMVSKTEAVYERCLAVRNAD